MAIEDIHQLRELLRSYADDGGKEDPKVVAFFTGLMLGAAMPEEFSDLADAAKEVAKEFSLDEIMKYYTGKGEKGEKDEKKDDDDDKEASYAAKEEGDAPLRLLPSRKNPKVRRWQRIGDKEEISDLKARADIEKGKDALKRGAKVTAASIALSVATGMTSPLILGFRDYNLVKGGMLYGRGLARQGYNEMRKKAKEVAEKKASVREKMKAYIGPAFKTAAGATVAAAGAGLAIANMAAVIKLAQMSASSSKNQSHSVGFQV